MATTNPFQYSTAIVCGIPDSLAAAALRMDASGEPVNTERARQQHEEYLQVLASIMNSVIFFMCSSSMYVKGKTK